MVASGLYAEAKVAVPETSQKALLTMLEDLIVVAEVGERKIIIETSLESTEKECKASRRQH
tara:strand:- start:1314 stop:1496 length:183 start_codon:yes stop_codon:yes gene_type:complete